MPYVNEHMPSRH